MKSLRHLGSVRILTLIICGLVCLGPSASGQAPVDPTVRSLIADFFTAYQKRDVVRLMALWNEKSPNLALNKDSIQKRFQAADKMEWATYSFDSAELDGESVAVRIVLGAAPDQTTTAAERDRQKMHLALDLVKTEGGWKIWRCVALEEELAAKVVAARTDEERRALMASEKDLVTRALDRALCQQGANLSNRGNHELSLAIYQLALSTADELGDRAGKVLALFGISGVYYSRGDYRPLEAYMQDALRISEELGNKALISIAVANLGLVYSAQGDYPRARRQYTRSVEIAREANEKGQLEISLLNIGNTYFRQGSFAEALDYYSQGLEVGKGLVGKGPVPLLLSNSGDCYREQGNFVRALQEYNQSLAVASEMKSKPQVARALGNIGELHYRQGSNMQALKYLQQGLDLAMELGEKKMSAGILKDVGRVHQALKDYSRSLQDYKEALRLATELGDKELTITCLAAIADQYRVQGNSAEALEYYGKAVQLAEETGSKELIADSLERTASIHEEHGEAMRALSLAERAANTAREIGAPEIYSRSRAVAGKAHRDLNQVEPARVALSDAVTTIEDLRNQLAGGEQEQQTFLAENISPYHAMIDLLIDQNKSADALAYAERAKGRTLLELLRHRGVSIAKGMTRGEREREHDLNGTMVSLNTQIYRERLRQHADAAHLDDLEARLKNARLEYEAFQIELYTTHPELKAQRGMVEPFDLKRAEPLVNADETALLEYTVTDENVYLFVVTGEERQLSSQVHAKRGGRSRISLSTKSKGGRPVLNVYRISVKAKELGELVDRFRNRLGSLDFSYKEYSARLYDLLVRPARAQLRNRASLIIIPDGPLWDLPFQALQPAKDRYMINNASISYVPSIAVLLEFRKAHERRATAGSNSQTLFALGNPELTKETLDQSAAVFMDERLVPLPEAETQVKRLQSLYGPARCKIYTGAEAREDRFKSEAGRYRIIHLAAHGILNDASPMYSQLVLSPPKSGQDEDGLLEAWEIMGLQLDADLAVLSACETARGKVRPGEGVIGMAWAFFVAGVPTTVVSQWRVEAKSTSELMLELHRNLIAGRTKAESLRQAALKLMADKKYEHPFYWAGFVAMGNDQ